MERIGRKMILDNVWKGMNEPRLRARGAAGFMTLHKDMSMTRSRDDRDGVVRESADASFWNPVVHTNMFRVLSVRSLAVRLSSVCELNSCIYSPSPHRATRWEEIVCGLRSKARQDRGAVCNHLRIILLNTHVCMRLVKLL